MIGQVQIEIIGKLFLKKKISIEADYDKYITNNIQNHNQY